MADDQDITGVTPSLLANDIEAESTVEVLSSNQGFIEKRQVRIDSLFESSSLLRLLGSPCIFFVSQARGDDNNSGTVEDPFATIQKGVDEATALGRDVLKTVVIEGFGTATATGERYEESVHVATRKLNMIGLGRVVIQGVGIAPGITISNMTRAGYDAWIAGGGPESSIDGSKNYNYDGATLAGREIDETLRTSTEFFDLDLNFENLRLATESGEFGFAIVATKQPGDAGASIENIRCLKVDFVNGALVKNGGLGVPIEFEGSFFGSGSKFVNDNGRISLGAQLGTGAPELVIRHDTSDPVPMAFALPGFAVVDMGLEGSVGDLHLDCPDATTLDWTSAVVCRGEATLRGATKLSLNGTAAGVAVALTCRSLDVGDTSLVALAALYCSETAAFDSSVDSRIDGGTIVGNVTVDGGMILTLNGVDVIGTLDVAAGSTVIQNGGSLVGAQTGAGTYTPLSVS